MVPLKHFHLAEFECRCKCGRAEMLPAFLTALDELRSVYGRPMVITSGYRCPRHNMAVSGTGPTGPHTTGQAADILVDRGNAYELMRLAVVMGFTGIGFQQKGPVRFLHLDTLRDAPGQPRPTIWSY